MYFAIAGSTFVGIYTLPSYKYEDWQLLAAIPLGLAAGALALLTIVAVGLVTKLTAPLVKRTILRSTIGGIAFGLVGVALPLTLFTGTDQLTTVIHDGAALGAGLLIAVVFAKMIVFALCEATGFIGGPFLVMLFIGGTAGVTTHVLIPGLPEGLAFTAMFAALPGSLVAAPFSLILLARSPPRSAPCRSHRSRSPSSPATLPSRARVCSCPCRTAHASRPPPARRRRRSPRHRWLTSEHADIEVAERHSLPGNHHRAASDEFRSSRDGAEYGRESPHFRLSHGQHAMPGKPPPGG